MADGKSFALSGVDEAAGRLNEAYATYRFLTFDPIAPAIRRSEFLDQMLELMHAYRRELEPSPAARGVN